MPLTVLQLLPDLEAGGVERGTLEVAAELVRSGHNSIVISGGGRLVNPLRQTGSQHHQWPIGAKSPATLLLVPRLRRLLREQKVDVVHARSRVPAWLTYWAWRSLPATNRPHFVTTVHGLYSVNAYSAVMTRGDRVIAISQTVRRYITEHYPKTDPERIRVIYRGVAETEFPFGYRPDPRLRQQLTGGRPGPVLTLPGRLTRLKGHADFCELLRRLPAATGLIVGGEDPRRQAYAAELRRQAPPNVLFTGHRADMREVMAASDLVVSLSYKPEAFGRTALEALSLGVPVIGYDHGGVGEILSALYPFGRVEVGDLTALIARVQETLAGAPPVAPNRTFGLSRMLAETLAVYAEVAR